MNWFLVIAAALLPVILLFLYIHKQDSDQPEPAKWLWKAVRYGVYSALLVIICVSPFTGDYLDMYGAFEGSIFNAFFMAAIPEEAAKMFMIWLLLRKNPFFDEHLDGVVYASCVGLGFAGFENILYLFTNLDSFLSVAVMRALFSVPAHFFFAIVMGYFISRAYFGSKTDKSKFYLLAYAVPMLLHGIFDSLLMVSGAIPQLAALLVIAFLFFCNYLRKKAVKHIKELKAEDKAIAAAEEAAAMADENSEGEF